MGKVIDRLRSNVAGKLNTVLTAEDAAELLNEINDKIFQGQIAENLSISEFLKTRAADDIRRKNVKAGNYVLALKQVIDDVRAKRIAAMPAQGPAGNAQQGQST